MATTTTKAIGQATPAIAMPKVRKLPAWLRALLRNPLSITGAIIVLLFVTVAVLAPVLAPPEDAGNPYAIPNDGYRAVPQQPSSKHILGTTEGQYDIYYGIIWGTRTAFKVGLIITALTVLIGGTVGAVSAYAGGWVDEVIQRFVEIVLAFPFLMAALTMAVVLSGGHTIDLFGMHMEVQIDQFQAAMFALIAFSWPGYARLIRGDVLTVKERDFVLAARVIGAPNWRILVRHILPNSIYSLLVVASLDIGTYVLAFAALSFLNLGAPVGYADWGQLLSFARNWIPDLSKYWHIVVFPGFALVLFVLGWNLIGDAFRDALDPKLRGNK